MNACPVCGGSVSIAQALESLRKRNAELEALFNTPEISDFLRGVEVEAKHQRLRWDPDHDAQKQDEDWFWTLGYLAGKALQAQRSGDHDKHLHHLISSAALLSNWHARSVNR